MNSIVSHKICSIVSTALDLERLPNVRSDIIKFRSLILYQNNASLWRCKLYFDSSSLSIFSDHP